MPTTLPVLSQSATRRCRHIHTYMQLCRYINLHAYTHIISYTCIHTYVYIHTDRCRYIRSFVCFNTHPKQGVWAENSARCAGDYLRITRGASVWLYTKRPPACSTFAAKLRLHRWGTWGMIEEDIIVRDELAFGGSAWVGCTYRWSRFGLAGEMMTAWWRVECGSGALAAAAESPRMTPAYEDGKGRMHSAAAASSESDSSIQA